MRKLMLAIAMAGCQWLSAQSPLDSLSQKVSRMFAHFDPGKVPSGRLYDKGWALINPRDFTPDNPHPREASWEQFALLYNTFRSAELDSRNPWPSLESKVNESNAFPRNQVPLFLVDADIDWLKEEALASGNVRVDGESVLPVAENYGSFLQRDQVLALGTPRQSAQGPNVAFVLPAGFVFSDADKAGLEVHLRGEGGAWVPFGSSGVVTLSFSGTSEKKRVEYKLSRAGLPISTGSFELFVTTSVTSGGVDWPIPPQMGSHSGGLATITFAHTNPTGRLRKPIIVCEGVDYYKVAPDLVQENSTWEHLQELIRLLRLNNQLVLDYDFVYLDYAEGADAIERNAALLREVINRVNADKAAGGSTEPNVVIGYSMGGLVARYGLSQMAKEGINSQTRLLITHDSPHQGANIPLGLQFLAQEIRGSLSWTGSFLHLDQVEAMYNAPATQQMLLYRCTSGSTVVPNTWLESVYKPMITFPAGSPAPFSTVATSLGSECGALAFSPGQSLLHLNFEFQFQSLLAGLEIGLGTKKKWKLEMQAWASKPNGNQISKIKFTHSRKLFGGLINLDMDLINWSRMAPSGLTYVDEVPGGVFSMRNFYPFVTAGVNLHVFSFNGRLSMGPGFTFIPVKSALDVDGNELSLYLRPYNAWNPTPPNSRITLFRTAEPQGPERNHAHVSLTPGHATFLNNMIRNLPLGMSNCPAECGASTTLAGPASICPGSSDFFSLEPTPPAGSIIHWTHTQGGTLSGQGHAVADFTVDPGNTIENITLTATVNFAGCGYSRSKTFNGLSNLPPLRVICSPQPSNPIAGSGLLCREMAPSAERYVVLVDYPIGVPVTGQGAIQVTWTPLPGDNGISPTLEPVVSSSIARHARIWANGADPLRFRVRAEGDCGFREKVVEMAYTEAYPGTNVPCVNCLDASFTVVNPQPAVHNQDAYVSFRVSNRLPLPATGWIEDRRGNRLQVFSLDQAAVAVSIGQLAPARYKLVAVSGADREEADLVILGSGGDKLVISPNPVMKEVDFQTEINIVGEESPDNQFEVSLATLDGRTVKQFQADGRNFMMDVRDLDVGSYVLTVQGAHTLFQENLELTMQGKPYLAVSPNPAAAHTQAEVVNPLVPNATWTVEVRDKLGLVLKSFQTDQNPALVPVSDLLPDLYYIQMGNGRELYTKIFWKN